MIRAVSQHTRLQQGPGRHVASAGAPGGQGWEAEPRCVRTRASWENSLTLQVSPGAACLPVGGPRAFPAAHHLQPPEGGTHAGHTHSCFCGFKKQTCTYLPRGYKHSDLKGSLHPSAYGGKGHCSQTRQRAQLRIDIRRDKDVRHTQTEYYSAIKKGKL